MYSVTRRRSVGFLRNCSRNVAISASLSGVVRSLGTCRREPAGSGDDRSSVVNSGSVLTGIAIGVARIVYPVSRRGSRWGTSGKSSDSSVDCATGRRLTEKSTVSIADSKVKPWALSLVVWAPIVESESLNNDLSVDRISAISPVIL